MDQRVIFLGTLSTIPNENILNCLRFLSPADLRIVSLVNKMVLVLITTHWGPGKGEFSTCISLWQHHQGRLEKVDDLICSHLEYETVLNDETSFFILNLDDNTTMKISFGNSYQKIFQELALTFEVMSTESIPLIRADVSQNSKRFNRMPSSQKCIIRNKLRNFSFQGFKDDKRSFLALSKAIQCYIQNTITQPLPNIPPQHLPEKRN